MSMDAVSGIEGLYVVQGTLALLCSIYFIDGKLKCSIVHGHNKGSASVNQLFQWKDDLRLLASVRIGHANVTQAYRRQILFHADRTVASVSVLC